ncbi:MAG: hypothetical protein ACLQVN_04990 [Bryobacteraceae bacterium]
MKTTSYNKAFDDAARELERRLGNRDELDLRILQLRDTMFALAKMLHKNDSMRHQRLNQVLQRLPAGSPNLTAAVRDAVYDASSRRLTAAEVRDRVAKRSPDLAGNPHLLAAIHSTLKRLERQGEVSSEAPHGAAAYRWNGPTYGARNSLANQLACPADPDQGNPHAFASPSARGLLRRKNLDRAV